ncbi:tetratricopeptide repeat protein [Pseudomonas zhanjiangensis]|uniref:Tetratricopeptide repeat protein n=1 Tax=Pseudomonas zhanjiangensis TaxID=3239015 RepID=A0ABV3YP34_9PSED
MLESLEKMLAQGIDNALLRFGLGKGYLDAGEFARAAQHFRRCVEFDPNYSAAWKLLGKALLEQGNRPGAEQAWQKGIAAAQGHGDKQAEKEMTVFLKRLQREQSPPDGT